MKKSLKMEIVSDYVIVKEIAFYSQNLKTDCNFLKERAAKLLSVYKKLLFKNGLFDLSLAILEKELVNNSFISENEKKMLEKIEKIEGHLPVLIGKLNYNNFEMNYLTE